MFSVSVYKKSEIDTPFCEDLSFETPNLSEAIDRGQQIAKQVPDVFVEVWKRDNQKMYGNSGEPLYASEGSGFYNSSFDNNYYKMLFVSKEKVENGMAFQEAIQETKRQFNACFDLYHENVFKKQLADLLGVPWCSVGIDLEEIEGC
jgi:hypothetical protein